MSKFNIFTIDLRVIWWIIVATGVYALLLKFLQKNSPHDVQTKGGGVQRPFEQCSKKLHFSFMTASLIMMMMMMVMMIVMTNANRRVSRLVVYTGPSDFEDDECNVDVDVLIVMMRMEEIWKSLSFTSE